MAKVRALDPVLYARIILLMKRGQRREAVAAVEEELQMSAAEASAYVESLWQRYEEEIPPTQFADFEPRKRRSPWIGVVAVAAFVLAFAVGRLLLLK